MSQKIAVSKTGSNVLTATDPNDFIFHSDYNTFKIVASGTANFTQDFGNFDETFAHNLAYTPLVYAFMKVESHTEILCPNYQFFKTAPYNVFRFNYVKTDATNVIFSWTNWKDPDPETTVYFKYYIFEVPL